MKFTDQELRKAVRKAGRKGETFASADVRHHLGLDTKDRSELTRFQNRFRAFLKTSEELEKVERNRYRFTPKASSQARAAGRKRGQAGPKRNPEAARKRGQSEAELAVEHASVDDVTTSAPRANEPAGQAVAALESAEAPVAEAAAPMVEATEVTVAHAPPRAAQVVDAELVLGNADTPVLEVSPAPSDGQTLLGTAVPEASRPASSRPPPLSTVEANPGALDVAGLGQDPEDNPADTLTVLDAELEVVDLRPPLDRRVARPLTEQAPAGEATRAWLPRSWVACGQRLGQRVAGLFSARPG